MFTNQITGITSVYAIADLFFLEKFIIKYKFFDLITQTAYINILKAYICNILVKVLSYGIIF